MKHLLWKTGAATLALLLSNAHATEVQEQTYLTQIYNQLNAIQPLVLGAQKAQLPHARATFHYTKFCDKGGKCHNGLLEDILEIKKGIMEKLNQPPLEPRTFDPLQGDYLPRTYHLAKSE